MANENLKVNSKTDILEFKRKHNNLVDKVGEMAVDAVESVEELELSGDLSVTGNANVSGNVAISGDANIDGNITGDSIIENMSGYSVELVEVTGYTFEPIYAGAVKNGNKLTLVFAWNYTRTEDATNLNPYVIKFKVPSSIADKLYTTLVGGSPVLDIKTLYGFSTLGVNIAISSWTEKGINEVMLQLGTGNMVQDTKYYIRYEVTFLLSDNLIPEQQGD